MVTLKDYGDDFLAIFDLDGTLIDSSKQIEFCMNKIREDSGFGKLNSVEYLRLIGQPVEFLISDLNLPHEKVDIMIARFRSLLKETITKQGVDCFAKVVEAFQSLEELRVKTAIATTKPTDLAIFTIARTSLRNFDIHIQGTDNFDPKPSPIVIQKILMELKPKFALMVGDRIEDIQAGVRAGINGIGIASGAHGHEDLRIAGAIATFSDFASFNQILDTDPKKFREYFRR
jgi:phosphoglycolate phosphatase